MKGEHVSTHRNELFEKQSFRKCAVNGYFIGELECNSKTKDKLKRKMTSIVDKKVNYELVGYLGKINSEGTQDHFLCWTKQL